MKDDISSKILETRHDAEWAFLLCAVSDQEYAIKKCGGLLPSMFINKRLGKYWQSLKERKDPITAANEIDIQLFGEISSKQLDVYVNYARIDEYERLIWKTHYALDCITNASKIAKYASNLDVDDAYKFIVDISKIPPFFNDAIKVNTASVVNNIYREKLTENYKGIDYSFPKLQATIGNLRKGTLTYIAGRPGMGKTSMSLQFGKNIAMNNHMIIYFSLEMDKIRLWERMLSTHCSTELSKLREMSNEYKAEQSENLSNILGDNFIICDNAYTPQEIERECLLNSPDVIIIDHVDEMRRPEYSKENIWRSSYMKDIRDFSKEHEMAVIAVLQLNRNTDDRQDKRPLLMDLRWDGGLEQVADIVLMGYAEEYYTDTNVISKNIPFELWVRKNRDGNNNVCTKMLYNLKTQYFNDSVTESHMSDKF
jgi:replicative DNA helicase